MITIGLTGGFGMGKSTVAEMFSRLGALIINADILGHEALRHDEAIRGRLKARFGAEVFAADGEVDRKRLGDIVFSDDEARAFLNELVHPYIMYCLKEDLYSIRQTQENAIVVVEMPLLVEAGLTAVFDYIIVVKVEEAEQIARCEKKWRLSSEKIRARIAVQLPITDKLRVADFVIDNTLSLDHTHMQVKNIWEQLHEGVQKEEKPYGSK